MRTKSNNPSKARETMPEQRNQSGRVSSGCGPYSQVLEFQAAASRNCFPELLPFSAFHLFTTQPPTASCKCVCKTITKNLSMASCYTWIKIQTLTSGLEVSLGDPLHSDLHLDSYPPSAIIQVTCHFFSSLNVPCMVQPAPGPLHLLLSTEHSFWPLFIFADVQGLFLL